ncbi:HtaA domain-containing protein [Streptomyces luteireticuli]|uniref:HtaA domain-containing protein n=1 Tax=Streptomyces luteireticuli TaxID=173858 RepID=UPI0035564C2E
MNTPSPTVNAAAAPARPLGGGRRRLARTAAFVVTTAVGTALTWTAAAPAFAAAPAHHAVAAPAADSGSATVPVKGGELVWSVYGQLKDPKKGDKVKAFGGARQSRAGTGPFTFTGGTGVTDAEGNLLRMTFKGTVEFRSAKGYTFGLGNLKITQGPKGPGNIDRYLTADVMAWGKTRKNVRLADLSWDKNGWATRLTIEGARALGHPAFEAADFLEDLTFSYKDMKLPSQRWAWPSESNALSWAVHSRFDPRTTQVDGGEARVTDGAKLADSLERYVFPVGEATANGSGSTTIAFKGAVRHVPGSMSGAEGHITFSNLKAVIQGDTGYLTADVTSFARKFTGMKVAKVTKTSPGVRLAELDPAKAERRPGKGGGTTLRDIPATLTAEGAEALDRAGFKEGTPLAPVTLSYGAR